MGVASGQCPDPPREAPPGVTATDGSCRLLVNWTMVEDPDWDVDYQVLRDGNVIATRYYPPYEDTNAAPGQVYSYTVRARNSCGTGPSSAPDSGSREAVAPDFLRIYVDASAAPGGNGSSWATAVSDLKVALSLTCAPSNELWIADGVYTAIGSSFVVPRGTTLLGGFFGGETSADERDWKQHPAVLTAAGPYQNDPETDRPGVVRINATSTAPSVLDGLEISGGGWWGTQGSGGGVSVGGRAELRNCIVGGCTALYGGGLWVGGRLDMFDCILEGNSSGFVGGGHHGAGGGAEVRGTLIMQRCIVRNNQTTCYDLDEDDYCDGGEGAGISVGHRSIGPEPNAMFRAENCLFTGNAAWSGAAVYKGDGAASLVNCTVAGNSGGASFGELFAGAVTIENCIIWGNSAEGRAEVIGRNITQGIPGGMHVDPLLDTSFRPMAGSPAIDAGDNALLTSDTDLSGLPRRVDDCATTDTGAGESPFVDLGALEFQGCRADWNCADGVDSQDFFDFLEAFFAGDADFNGVDGTDSQDYVDFLEAFFGGC